MGTYTIGYEGKAPEARPNNGRMDKRIRVKAARGGVATVGETQAYIKERFGSVRREKHTDGFLAISSPARTCECGGCCTYVGGYICPRCGEDNG